MHLILGPRDPEIRTDLKLGSVPVHHKRLAFFFLMEAGALWATKERPVK